MRYLTTMVTAVLLILTELMTTMMLQLWSVLRLLVECVFLVNYVAVMLLVTVMLVLVLVLVLVLEQKSLVMSL